MDEKLGNLTKVSLKKLLEESGGQVLQLFIHYANLPKKKLVGTNFPNAFFEEMPQSSNIFSSNMNTSKNKTKHCN
jgi:hypothetical protein